MIGVVDLGRYAREMRIRWGGVYERGSLPAGAYGLSERVTTITIPNYGVVGDRMDAALAHDLTSVLFSSGRVTDRERAQDVIAEIGLHPGARAYFSGG